MRQRLFPLFLSLVIIGLDQFSKLLVRRSIPLYSYKIVIPDVMNIVHIENRGIAFGFFNSCGYGPIILTLVSIGVVVFLFYLIWVEEKEGPFFKGSLGLVLGGAVGNLIDRIMWGRVIDFLDFHLGPYHWPAFNVADMAISLGGIFIFFSILKKGTAHASHSH